MKQFMLFMLFGFIVSVTSESCYYHRCLGCRPEAALLTGHPVECGPENWVSPEWITQNVHPPPSTGSRIPIEYRCLKIVSSPEDSSLTNTVDVLRGCIPERKVDGICDAILSMQRARGYVNSKCYVCRGNNCNTGNIMPKPVFLILILSIFSYLYCR